MKQSTAMIAGVGLLVLVLGVVFFALRGGKSATGGEVMSQQENNTQSEQPISGTFSGSMKDLVAKNQSVKCTFTHSTKVDSSSGTVFVSGGKVRGDFDISVPQSKTSFTAHMIADGENTYVWSSLLPQGFKMPLSNATLQSSSQPTSGVDYNQTLDYQCESWSVDQSVFITPAGISFVSAPTKSN